MIERIELAFWGFLKRHAEAIFVLAGLAGTLRGFIINQPG